MTDVVSRPEIADLSAKYRVDEGEFFFTGVQALVRVPLTQMRRDRRAGLRTGTFISGYQGSPLGGFDRELLSHRATLDELDIVHVQGVNEELGATAVAGSQMVASFDDRTHDGVLGIWYGKAPGLDRATDAMRHGMVGGAHRLSGVLALVGDDPACKSSTMPSASEHALEDLSMPVLYPGTVQEVLDFGLAGVAMSRATGLWVAEKIVTSVADGAGTVLLNTYGRDHVTPTIDYKGVPYETYVGVPFAPHSVQIEEEIWEAKLPLARLFAAQNSGINEITVDAPNAWLGIVAAGHTYYETIAALRRLGLEDDQLRGLGVRVLRMGMISPVEPDILRRFAAGLDEVLVVEEKRPFLERAFRDLLYGTANAPRIVGKKDPEGANLVPAGGVLDADTLAPLLRRRLTVRISRDKLAPEPSRPVPYRGLSLDLLPARSPFFCSGCPHNTSTQVPKGATVGAGIGCHGMVLLMDEDRVGNVIGGSQMGGEGVQWIGIEPFVVTDHFIQNLGDGTFFHSGSLAIRQSVAAKAHVTYKILYNGTVAMTGGQDAAGNMTPTDITHMLLREGVARVIITTDDTAQYRKADLPNDVDVWDRRRIIEAQEVLATVAGVTVLIHDQACAAEKRRDRKRGIVADPAARIVINERVCEGCGDCGDVSNCLSVQPIETEFGRKTAIHQSSCNKDYSCLEGDCPSFLTLTPKKSKGRRGGSRGDKMADRSQGGARRRPALDVADLVEPTLIVPADDMTIRMPGIGGTGVVTVNQMLGTAAMLDGRYVSGLDQTGLSQKAGPVVSDLRISTSPVEGTNKAIGGTVDCYLVLDLLVGLSPANLAGASPHRTVAIVSTSKTATGAMVRDVNVTFPEMSLMTGEMDAMTRATDNVYLDAMAVAEGLFGESTTSNVLALGVAYQRGCLPISAEAIEAAIEANGAAVEANRLAFRWGRMFVIDEARVRATMSVPPPTSSEPDAADLAAIGDLDEGELGRLLRIRVPDLVDYQDRSYADRYLDTIRIVATSERRAAPGSTVLTETAARYLYKLMAYKDEYEVARLHLDAAAKARALGEVEGDVAVTYNLHPPMLKAMGLERKIPVGSWVEPALKALARSKSVRGTKADLFGYAKVRRIERALVKEYVEVLDAIAVRIDADNHAAMVAVAALPDMVRGYEDLKIRNVTRYRQELSRLTAELGLGL